MKLKTHIPLITLALGAIVGAPDVHAQSGRQAAAIFLRDSPKSGHLSSDPYGDHGSSARANIVDTAKCTTAETSWRAHTGKIQVWLHSTMLISMKNMIQSYGYSYFCGFIAGGQHSSGSYHYRGTAMDISTINGRGVSSSNPYWRTFNQRCRDRGAVESLGPGYPGHSTHVHNAWPSGGAASSSGGCITQVSAPSGLNATTVDHDSIKVTWNDNSSINTAQLLQKSGTSSTGPWATAASLGSNAETHTESGLGSGKKYWFRVRASNSSDTSPWSNVDNATTKDTKAAAPSALTATAVSNDQINLAWTDNSGNEDGFKVYRSTDGTNFAAIKTVGINVKTYSNTGLAGNRKYWYRVYAYNTAGNSSASNTASDTTAPHAPTVLTVSTVAGTTNWNKLNLAWTDNAGSEVGFKIERGTAAAGPFSQIATNPASDATFSDSGLAATTTYYYRVRAYNANGNSDYSNVASKTTPNAPPVLSTIGNKTVNAGSALAFTVSASDPNKTVTTTTFQTFQSYSHSSANDTIMFHKPSNSGTTSAFMDTSTNYTLIRTNGPTGNGSTHAMKVGWGFKSGMANAWVRLNTFNTATNPNPAIALDQQLRFKVHTDKAIKIGLGIRETGTTAAYGANGGTTGAIEWVGVTNVVSSHPVPNKLVAASTWTTLNYNIPFEPQVGFTGDGIVPQSGVKGVLEHLIVRGEGTSGAYNVYLDDFAVLAQNTLAFSLDAGAPAGASVERRTGKFTWTPSAGQAGVHTVTIRSTDQLGAQDFESIQITVVGAGNAAPVLSNIGAKTVKEGTALAFTASATDANAGQTLTYSLDAGAPSGSSINASSGAFSWTPTEAQGPGSYPITVRVTDNGSPASNDTEVVTVSVSEVNVAPVLAAIADQTANEQQLFSFTPSASDSDVPAQSFTWSLVSGPENMTINATSGQISWTPTEADGPEIQQVTVRVRDNGSPQLLAERSFNVNVNEVNTAPVLTLGTTAITGVPITDFETQPDGTVNGSVFFRQPSFSASTTSFLDPAPIWSSVTETFPEGVGGLKTLNTYFSFKTGTVNPWLRLTTFNTTAGYIFPNPTVELNKTVRFSIYCDRSIKVALGIRETSTSAAIGADGGTTGTLEWVGATSSSGSPNPSRVVPATNWTTLEFNLASDVITGFPGSGNGVLSSTTGKGVLEHLAIVPNDGSGVYTIYVDSFEVLVPSASFTVDTGKTISITNGATDVDDPKQALTFSLEANAPTNMIIDSKSGTITWTPTPEQGGGAFVFGVRVTDDGVPAMSDVENLTINVNLINTTPVIVQYLQEFFVSPGELVEFDASADDYDLAGDVLSYSFIGTTLSGSTLDSVEGIFTWTPSTANGSNYTTIRVTDNSTPPLHADLTLVIVVSPSNAAPVLTVSQARAVEPVVNFETFTNGTPSEQVMFKKPANSATTSQYIDTTVTNYTTVTTSFPAGNANAGSKALRAEWTFKTGVTDYWVRLTTANTTFVPNPVFSTIARVKFDIHTSKALKVGLGIREANSTAENGGNGGLTGAIEYVGCTSKVGTTPVPSRAVNANTWTTLEFDMPIEPCQTLTGDSILAAGQQVLEHLILKGEGGTGVYTVYVDNFDVVTTTALPGTLTMKAGTTVTFTSSGSDPDFHAITLGIEEGAPASSTFNPGTGAFSWTPDASYVGTTNDITPYVEDAPPGGFQTKRDGQTLTVIVAADTLGAQSTLAAGESANVEWDAVPGASYQVQVKNADGTWSDVGEPIVATDSTASVILDGADTAREYRIVGAGDSAE